MKEFPHRYSVRATAESQGLVSLDGEGLPSLRSAPPAEFGGPGDEWSPETLLVAAVADCFILTFRAMARASKLEWRSLSCQVEGVLDRVDRITRFTDLLVRASLEIPSGMDPDRARRLLERAEQNCLITSSLKAESQLETEVEVIP
jgi:peroxiredoxin-like protein